MTFFISSDISGEIFLAVVQGRTVTLKSRYYLVSNGAGASLSGLFVERPFCDSLLGNYSVGPTVAPLTLLFKAVAYMLPDILF